MKTNIVFAMITAIILFSCDSDSADSCGNGAIDPGEECDQDMMVFSSCSQLGFYEQSSPPFCSARCVIDTSGCSKRCGDGVIQVEHGEQCEGLQLNGSSCQSLGFAGGTLLCGNNCQFNPNSCTPGSGNADLRSLYFDKGFLDPYFSSDVTTYSAFVPFSVSTITLTAIPADENATVQIVPAQPMTVSLGSNLITVTVTAQNGTLKVYSIDAIREETSAGKMIRVPGGTFQRSSSSADTSTVSSFYISEKEITRYQFTAVTGLEDPSDTFYSAGRTDPVQNANWYHAVFFCNRASLAEGLTPVYTINGSTNPDDWGSVPTTNNLTWNRATANWSANGYRLPTEMEWMWAAMGARDATTGYLKAFAGSTGTNLIDDYVWYDDSSAYRTNPVGKKLPNELALYDMSGNVWEWCWDWTSPYPAGALYNYRGPDSTTLNARVLRGGSWWDYASRAAVAYRSSTIPLTRESFYGFRVARQ